MCEIITDLENKLAGFYDGLQEDIDINDKLGKLKQNIWLSKNFQRGSEKLCNLEGQYCENTVKILKIRTPEKFAVTTLKFE